MSRWVPKPWINDFHAGQVLGAGAVGVCVAVNGYWSLAAASFAGVLIGGFVGRYFFGYERREGGR